MKRIKLTRGKFALVDDRDYEWLNQWKWWAGKHRYNFYAERWEWKNGKRTNIKMQYAILGKKKGYVIDHIDRNGLNNQRSNLRFATIRQNNINKRMHKNNTSGYMGVYWHKHCKKWAACIRKNGKSIHLGLFEKPEKASVVYKEATKKYHEGFASL